MEKPKLTLDFADWYISNELKEALTKAALDNIAGFVVSLLTNEDTVAYIQPEGLRVEAPEFTAEDGSHGITIPWEGKSLDIRGFGAYEGDLTKLTALFRFLRDRLDFWDVSEEDRAKLRAILD